MSRTQIQDADREEVAEFVERHWRSRMVISAGRAFHPHKEQGIIERHDGRIVGLLTYHVEDDGMVILTHNSTIAGARIGTSLMLNAIETARERKCRRVWLTLSNDMLRAVGLYQRLGFRLVKIKLGAIDEARMTKPQSPKVSDRGVPIRDEMVMELIIEPYLDHADAAGDDSSC